MDAVAGGGGWGGGWGAGAGGAGGEERRWRAWTQWRARAAGRRFGRRARGGQGPAAGYRRAPPPRAWPAYGWSAWRAGAECRSWPRREFARRRRKARGR